MKAIFKFINDKIFTLSVNNEVIEVDGYGRTIKVIDADTEDATEQKALFILN